MRVQARYRILFKVVTVAFDMGRRSKATQSRLQNLREASKSQRMRVHDVTSDEDEDSSGDAVIEDIGTGAKHGFIVFEDNEIDSDNDHIPGSNDSDSKDGDSDFEDEETNEIRIEADLLCFSAILTEAQRVAVKLEQESDAPKRPKRYTGNAPRMKRFHAQKSHTLAAEGQKFISQFFTANAKMPPQQSVNQPPIPSDSDSSDKESIIDVNEHLDQIFGREEDTGPSKNSEPESGVVSSPSAKF
jgi:hypothetical protein